MSEVVNEEGDGYDDLDDWYDRALKAGFGFKTEKEKQDYIASIGDPMKHPLFAQTTEDLKDHPLTEAFRCLREEDKTIVELAELYKEEGNQWLKKGTKRDFIEAYNRYVHALDFMDKAEQARLDGTECTTDSTADLKMIRSQILSNRALASLNLTNYGKCYKDCDKAIAFWPQNIKAHYRKCKALNILKKYPECIAACNAALAIEPTNKDFLTFKKQSATANATRNKSKSDGLTRTMAELTAKWGAVWDIAQSNRVALGYPHYGMPEPRELRDSWAHLDADTTSPATAGTAGAVQAETRWPVLLQYPQYGTYDVLSAAGATDMLVEHLAMAFPEKGDYEQRIEWDLHEEYQVSNIVVYVQLFASRPVASKTEWMEACMEQRVLLQGGSMELLPLVNDPSSAPVNSIFKSLAAKTTTTAGAGAGDSATSAAASASVNEVSIEKLKNAVEAREKMYWERMMDTATGKLVTNSGPGLRTSSVQFVEVHLGCTIGSIVKAHFPAHVLPRGVLTLLIYPRKNHLHKLFVEKNKDKIAVLNPVAV